MLFFPADASEISDSPKLTVIIAEPEAAAFKDDLVPYKVNKGTIRFPLSEPVPLKLIERIAKFRAKEVVEHQKTKAATPKKLLGELTPIAKYHKCLTPDRMIVHLQKSCLLGGSLFVNDSGRKWEEFHGFDNIQLSLPIT
jgi:hypothetical protein